MVFNSNIFKKSKCFTYGYHLSTSMSKGSVHVFFKREHQAWNECNPSALCNVQVEIKQTAVHTWGGWTSQVVKHWRIHLPSRRRGFDPWVRKIPWRRKWQPTPVFLPGKSHGQRSLAGYSPCGRQRVRHTTWWLDNNDNIQAWGSKIQNPGSCIMTQS